MALRKVVEENAKYKVFEGKKITEGYKPEEKLCVNNWYYTFGDVFTYALGYGKCPLEAFEDAKKLGYAIYWLIPDPLTLGALAEDKKHAFLVNVGEKVKYAGKIFTVEAAPNDNLVLVEN
jgi:hypothetical protein